MLIGLAGFKGSGKDFVGQILVDDYGFESCAFADPIKERVMEIFGLKTLQEYDTFKRDYLTWDMFGRKIDGRHIVREIGMLMRSYDEDQFVRYVWNRYQQSATKKVVVTDLRFENELYFLLGKGGLPIRVERAGTKSDGHVTEAGIKTKYEIDNNKDADHIRAQLDKILRV